MGDMGDLIRRHRATVIALVALVFSIVGTAAATQVLVKKGTRTVVVKQPAAHSAAKGKRGPRGPAGPAGPQGATGSPGAAGAQGPGAVRLSYFKGNAEPSFTAVGMANELTIEGRCAPNGNDTVMQVRLTSSVQGETDFSMVTNDGVTTGDATGGAALAAGTPVTFPAGDLSPVSGPDHGTTGELKVVNMIYKNASRTISIQMLVESDHQAGSCHINGVAVPAS